MVTRFARTTGMGTGCGEEDGDGDGNIVRVRSTGKPVG